MANKKRITKPGQTAEINWEVVEAVCEYGATLNEVAERIGVHPCTIERHIRDKFDCTFKEYRDRRAGLTVLKLRQKQIEVALKGNVSMLIWLGKNLMGQTDKVESSEKELPSREFSFPDPKEVKKILTLENKKKEEKAG